MNELDNIEELDLKYQFAMLASHVEDFLKEAFDTWSDGVYHIRDKQLDPMRMRLEAIRVIQSGNRNVNVLHGEEE